MYFEDATGATIEVGIQPLDRATKFPTGVVLVSASQYVTSLGWYHFQFDAPYSVLAGAQLAITFTLSGPSTVGISADHYLRGEGLVFQSGWKPLGMDYDFRTYMDLPTPTPAATSTRELPAATATPAPAATSDPAASEPGSGDFGGLLVPLAIVGVLALIATVGGLGFLLGRRRRADS
jgi:hypothetical protein